MTKRENILMSILIMLCVVVFAIAYLQNIQEVKGVLKSHAEMLMMHENHYPRILDVFNDHKTAIDGYHKLYNDLASHIRTLQADIAILAETQAALLFGNSVMADEIQENREEVYDIYRMYLLPSQEREIRSRYDGPDAHKEAGE